MLMTRKMAEAILESEDMHQQQRSEILAEAGMGAVSMGFDGYDGMAVASAQMAESEAKFFDSPAGQEHSVRLKLAKQTAADFDSLEIGEESSFNVAYYRNTGNRVIPEYYPFGKPNPIPF